MRKLQVIVVLFAFSTMITGCRKGIDKVLIGTWNVTRVEGVLNSGGTSSAPVTDENPTGTITFKGNGTGEQNYSFEFFGTLQQTGSFKWSATEDLIIIERTTESDMEWTRIIDTENRQVATYNILRNAEQNVDYTLTLEK